MRILKSTWMAGMLAIACATAVHAGEAPSYVAKPDAWFSTDEGKTIIKNIPTWQMPTGGWPKAYDAATVNTRLIPHVVPHNSTPAAAAATQAEGVSTWDTATIDNDATYSELRILARAVTLTQNEDAKAAFLKGYDSLLAAQYANGGWPQRWPLQNNYGRRITFNDNAMTNVMILLKGVAGGEAPYAFIDADRRAKTKIALDKGVECILNCQIEKDGKLTGWCAQHDEVTLKPAGARAYELPSISGSEGAGVAIFLMQLDHPSDRTRKAIDAAAVWFDSAKITGKRVVAGKTSDGKNDRIVVDDSASTIWARFYDLDTGKPFFCGRDGIKKGTLAAIELERRTGYAWYGNWGAAVAREYAAWKKRNPIP